MIAATVFAWSLACHPDRNAADYQPVESGVWAGRFPVQDLRHLPCEGDGSRCGLIETSEQFADIWSRLQNVNAPGTLPDIDFTQKKVAFLRNTRFVNRFRGVNTLLQGHTVFVRAATTRTARPIVDFVEIVLFVVPFRVTRLQWD